MANALEPLDDAVRSLRHFLTFGEETSSEEDEEWTGGTENPRDHHPASSSDEEDSIYAHNDEEDDLADSSISVYAGNRHHSQSSESPPDGTHRPPSSSLYAQYAYESSTTSDEEEEDDSRDLEEQALSSSRSHSTKSSDDPAGEMAAKKRADVSSTSSSSSSSLNVIVHTPGSTSFVGNDGPMPRLRFLSKKDLYDPDEEYEKNEKELTHEDLDSIGIRSLPKNATKAETMKSRNLPKFQVMEVYISFLKLRPSDVSVDIPTEDSLFLWLNQYLAYFTDHLHCELIFIVQNKDTKARTRLVSSIHRSHRLRLIKKEYKKSKLPYWQFFRINCSTDEMHKMFQYEMDNNRKPFNKMGFFLNFVLPYDWMRIDYDGEYVFCSEQICRNLIHTFPGLKLAEKIKPYATNPTHLLQFLQTQPDLSRMVSPHNGEPLE